MRLSDRKRSNPFRKKVIEYHKHGSKSGGSQMPDFGYMHFQYSKEEDDDPTSVSTTHIWKLLTRGHELQDLDLTPQEVNSARNGLFLATGLEEV